MPCALTHLRLACIWSYLCQCPVIQTVQGHRQRPRVGGTLHALTQQLSRPHSTRLAGQNLHKNLQHKGKETPTVTGDVLGASFTHKAVLAVLWFVVESGVLSKFQGGKCSLDVKAHRQCCKRCQCCSLKFCPVEKHLPDGQRWRFKRMLLTGIHTLLSILSRW